MHGIDKYAAKVYKMEGFSLADLQRQWPVATKAPQSRWAEEKRFVLGGVAFGEFLANCSEIKCGTFLWDGRFAFVMLRYWGDLRTLVDLKLSRQLNGPPFSHYVTVRIMHNIAQGMRGLHARGVLHRDLKAANVLVEIYSGDLLDRKFLETDFFDVVLADFESSMLVQGTGFWRAPEVLQELLKQPWDRNPQMWTEKVDVYSYAMTCYEVLTGHLPFYGYSKSDWQRVIDGERPHLPNYVDPTLGEIVERCWHRDPSERPAFEVIANELATIRLPLAQKMIDAGNICLNKAILPAAMS